MKYIANILSTIETSISRFFSMCTDAFDTIGKFFSYIFSVLEGLWFGLKSLFSGLWTFIDQVLSGELFSFLFDGFNDLSAWLGWGATFISGFLLIVFLRIIIAFVFKLFRLNVDYPEKIFNVYPNEYKGKPLN